MRSNNASFPLPANKAATRSPSTMSPGNLSRISSAWLHTLRSCITIFCKAGAGAFFFLSSVTARAGKFDVRTER